MKTKVTVEIDTDTLESLSDQFLSQLWHIAQANPASMEDEEAGIITEAIGREVIRRWVSSIPPSLWSHQGSNYYWSILQEHGKWLPVEGGNTRKWVPNKSTPIE